MNALAVYRELLITLKTSNIPRRCWNLSRFDQEGVQLGKVLAKKVLAYETDGALKVYSDLLSI